MRKILYLLLIPFFFFVYKIYRERVTTFGCFDDCFNYTAAYFMLKGRQLYSEIFFNHQMLPAYLSYVIQKFSHPGTIYELVLFHRLFLIGFSLVFDLLIIWRFRMVGAAFAVFYEPTKYYLFGDRFLAESFIVYPTVYMFGLLWYKLESKNIFRMDYVLAGIFAWFVIFMREPYIPLAIFLYFFLLWSKKFSFSKKISIAIFLFLSTAALLTTSLPDLFFNLVTTNTEGVFSNEVKTNLLSGWGIVKSFTYPLFLFFGGKWNNFRIFLICLSIIFLILLWFARKNKKLILIVIFLLGVANIRVVIPGTIFFESFHMIQWYGLFLMSIFMMLAPLYRFKKLLISLLILFAFSALGFLMLSPKSYLWDKINRHEEFVTGYGSYLASGEIIKLLAEPQDTLFLDNNRQDLTYWQANLRSPYKYSWYTWTMPGYQIFDEARLKMFQVNPPDFYYGDCRGEINSFQNLPLETKNNYHELYFAGRPTCLYVKKTKVEKINPQIWEKAKGFQYYLSN